MRWYVVLTPEPPLRPFVLSEWADDMFAVEAAVNWAAATLVTEDGSHEFGEAIAAWKAGDSTAYAEWLAAEAAEVANQDRDDPTASGRAWGGVETADPLGSPSR